MRLRWSSLALLTLLHGHAAEKAADGTCAVGGASCGAGGYYWPAQKGTPGRTGFSPHPVPDISRSPAWSWADTHSDTIRSTPLIDDKMNIYLTTVAGRMYKFDAEGIILWERALPFGAPAVASLYGGKLIMPSKRGDVLAFDMETGRDVWKANVSPTNLTGGDTASVSVFEGVVISATVSSLDKDNGNTDVVALKAEDGSLVWRFLPETQVYNFQASSPGDGTVVFQDRAGGLYRLGLRDGKLIWRSGKRGRPWSETFTTGAAVCHEGRVLVVSNTGADPSRPSVGILHTYDVKDGRLLWEQELAYAANQAATVGPHPTEKGRSVAVVGMGANPGLPLAADRKRRGIGWLPGSVAHMIDLYLSWLFVKTRSAMAAYDVDTGKQLWHYELPPYRRFATEGDSERLVQRLIETEINPFNDVICLPDSCSQPVIGPDGTAYQGWQSGKLYAVKDADGNGKIEDGEVSSFDLHEGFQGSIGLAPGLLAAAPCGGGLYVWRS